MFVCPFPVPLVFSLSRCFSVSSLGYRPSYLPPSFIPCRAPPAHSFRSHSPLDIPAAIERSHSLSVDISRLLVPHPPAAIPSTWWHFSLPSVPSDVSEIDQFSALTLFHRRSGDYSTFKHNQFRYSVADNAGQPNNESESCSIPIPHSSSDSRVLLPVTCAQSWSLWSEMLRNAKKLSWQRIQSEDNIRNTLINQLKKQRKSLEECAIEFDLPIRLIKELQRTDRVEQSRKGPKQSRSVHTNTETNDDITEDSEGESDWSPSDPASNSSVESSVQRSLLTLGLRFVSEAFLQQYQKDQSGAAYATPDIFLLDDVEFSFGSRRLPSVRWIEVKGGFGGVFTHRPRSVVSLNAAAGFKLAPTTEMLQSQMIKYCRTFGPGIVIFADGFCSALTQRLIVPEEVAVLNLAQFNQAIHNKS